MTRIPHIETVLMLSRQNALKDLCSSYTMRKTSKYSFCGYIGKNYTSMFYAEIVVAISQGKGANNDGRIYSACRVLQVVSMENNEGIYWPIFLHEY